MARGLFTIESSGLKDIIAHLEELGENYDRILKESLIAQQNVVLDKIRVNWVSMVGGQHSGYVYDSIGQSSAFSLNDPHVVVGTVGVYNIDSVKATHGITNKQLNAAQIAYWVEFGTSRTKSGARKVKGIDYQDEDLVSVAAKPFIGNAFYTSLDDQQSAFRERFNYLMDEIK